MTSDKRKRMRVDFDPDAFFEGVCGKLTPEEVGVYWMLCTLMYRARGPVDFDPASLAQTFAQTNARTITRIVQTLESLGKTQISLPQTSDSLPQTGTRVWPKLSNKRAMEEIKQTLDRIENGKKFGAKGGRPPSEKSHSNEHDPLLDDKRVPFPDEKHSRARTNSNDITSQREDEGNFRKGKTHPDLLDRMREAAGGRLDENSTGILNLAPILGLIAAGADVDRDILPAIREHVPRLKNPLRSWSAPWLHEEITTRRERRLREAGVAGIVPLAVAAAEFAETASDQTWRILVGRYLDTGGGWEEAWGMQPGHPQCRVPERVLEEVFHSRRRDLTAHKRRVQADYEQRKLEA